MATHYGDGAFPISGEAQGLTKREYFAGQALQGILAAYAGRDNLPTPQVVKMASIGYADDLIAALNGTGESS